MAREGREKDPSDPVLSDVNRTKRSREGSPSSSIKISRKPDVLQRTGPALPFSRCHGYASPTQTIRNLEVMFDDFSGAKRFKTKTDKFLCGKRRRRGRGGEGGIL